MPGIFGIVSSTPAPGQADRASAMANALTRFSWQIASTVQSEDEQATIGSVLLDTADTRAGTWKRLGMLS